MSSLPQAPQKHSSLLPLLFLDLQGYSWIFIRISIFLLLHIAYVYFLCHISAYISSIVYFFIKPLNILIIVFKKDDSMRVYTCLSYPTVALLFVLQTVNFVHLACHLIFSWKVNMNGRYSS